jgi:hypothetical protein
MRNCVLACLEAGLLKGDEHAITTFLWTTVHGAISAMVTFPQYSFGDHKHYGETVIELALTAVRTEGAGPLTAGAKPC